MVVASMLSDKLNSEKPGFYIDIRAFHPQIYSSTYYFYLQGWNGINVEPMPETIKLFKKLRGRDINLELGVSQDFQKLIYHAFDRPNCNTFCPESAERYCKEDRKIIFKKEIQTYPLSEILTQHLPIGQDIDFLNVDVEGPDLEVLKSNDWDRFRPTIVLVEDLNNISIDLIAGSELIDFMNSISYALVAKTLFTLIFKRTV